MGHVFLAIFLLVWGLNMLLGLGLPAWLMGALATVSGVLLLAERFRVRLDRRD